MQKENLLAKIRGQIEVEMMTNPVYKQSVQIKKMEKRLDKKKEQREERKKAWEINFEKNKEREDERLYRLYPELLYMEQDRQKQKEVAEQ